MRNLEHTTDITEGAATEAIFDACRANPESETRKVGDYTVSFGIFSNGREHEAAVRNSEGTVVALAIVDEFDA